MDFDNRLQRAIERGRTARNEAGRATTERELSLEESKSIHSRYRLQLVERIETCLKKLADHFPGFRFSPQMNERGWGATISRDDVSVSRDKTARSLYSRLEITVSSFGTAPIIELVAKGTIRNREVFHRRNFQQLAQVDMDSLSELIDLWVLEFAELYAAGN